MDEEKYSYKALGESTILNDTEENMGSFKSLEQCNKIEKKEQIKVEDRFSELSDVDTEKTSKPEATMSINDWLKHIEDNFIPLIFEGLNASTRASVVEAMKTNQELNYKQAMSIIHSLNHQVFQYIGHVRPDPTLCQCLATILKNNSHQSFDKVDTSSQSRKVGRKQQNHADLA